MGEKSTEKKDREWGIINVVILNRTVKEDLTEKCQRPEKVREKTRQTTREEHSR